MCALAWYRLLLLDSEEKCRTDDKGYYFDPLNPFLQIAEKCIEKALETDSFNSTLHCIYGMFLFKLRNFVATEDQFLRSLELDPNNLFTWVQYSNYLDYLGFTDVASEIAQHLLVIHTIISPLTCTEIFQSFKVYLDDGSFKSLSITPTMTTTDICISICKARNVTYHSDEWSLCLVSSEMDSNQWRYLNEEV
jgi:tetratricopeptide (TPR) repeat protein